MRFFILFEKRQKIIKKHILHIEPSVCGSAGVSFTVLKK